MLDFNKYDDASLIHNYEGFIDKLGNFYKVCHRNKSKNADTHNVWAEAYMKEKFGVINLETLQVTSLFNISQLNSPSEILINCHGFVYYSHDPIYHKPIIKIPNPKVAKYKVTEEQLNMLFLIMIYNNENTNIPILFGEEDVYSYCGMEEDLDKKIK